VEKVETEKKQEKKGKKNARRDDDKQEYIYGDGCAEGDDEIVGLAVAHDTVPGCTTTPIVATGHKSGSAAADDADSGSLSPAFKRSRNIDFVLKLGWDVNQVFYLGEPIPSVSLSFIDVSTREIVSLVGTFVLCLVSPIICLEGQREFVTSESYVAEHSVFSEVPLRAFPIGGDECFLGSSGVVTKVVDFTVRLFGFDEQGRPTIKIGSTKTVSMHFRPGRPHTIDMFSLWDNRDGDIRDGDIRDGDIVGYMGEDLPSILLVCYDEWGNRTAPGKDEIWRFTIDENAWVSGVLSQGYRVSSSTGEARLTGLKLTASGRQIPTEGQCVRISVRLVCSKEGAATQNSLTFSIDMKIIPDEVGAFVLY
jgi:hypothetical protein